MSSITQAKAEAQKLIKRYNQLQAEAKIADPSEATRKAAEADKLVSQISALQLAITKLQTRDKETALKKTTTSSQTVSPIVGNKNTTPATTGTVEKVKRATSSEKIVLEDRINRLEEAQNKTRAQIEQLTRAKAELTRLKQETEKSAATIKKRRANDEKLQQELAKLIEKKEAEHQALKKELDAVRQQAQKDAEMLKVQRDAARAMMERQKQLEKEQSLASQRRGGGHKGLVIGTGIVAIFALILGILLTSWFISSDPPSNHNLKAVAENQQIKEEKTVTKGPPKTKEIKAMETYRDQLKSNPGPLMVKLPKGTFKMGSKSSLPYPDERPQHEVTLESFSIGKYEVTFEEYGWFAVATGRQLPSDNGWGRGKRPVINVSWYDAVAYTEWLSEQTGYLYRLPSEREWEYAATAGTETTYWWGYKLERNQANCGVCGSQWDGRQTAPVGSFEPNPFSIYDTIGNVMEWTISCFRPTYQNAPSTGNIWEWGRKECSRRIVRSSSFKSYERSLRTTKRNKYKPTVRMDTLGFRVVRTD